MGKAGRHRSQILSLLLSLRGPYEIGLIASMLTGLGIARIIGVKGTVATIK